MTLGYETRLRAYIVNYADDLVIGCRSSADKAAAAMRSLREKLQLTVNEAKTRVWGAPDEKFDFRGYTFGRCFSSKTGGGSIGTVASKKRIQRLCAAIRAETGRNRMLLNDVAVVGTFNRIMIDWANSFGLGPVRKAYRAVEQHARKRLRPWLCAKHQLSWPATPPYPDAALHDVLGLDCLTRRTHPFPWAKS